MYKLLVEGWCDGSPAEKCRYDEYCGGGGQGEADCDCPGGTPYCDVAQNQFRGDCVAQEPAPNRRRPCCNDAECDDSRQGDAIYEVMCINPGGGMNQCGCCGVDNRDCCPF